MQKFIRALAVCLTVLAAATIHAQARTETADEHELRQLKEERWPKAYRDGDVALLDSILAPEFRLIDASGNWSTKQDELDYVAKHRPAYRAFRFEILRLEVFENGTAIVAGRGVVTGDAADPN
ncbi:MAG: nuclear transport factor 2 family protein, partial [Thermoanaerobaculia bacterium]